MVEGQVPALLGYRAMLMWSAKADRSQDHQGRNLHQTLNKGDDVSTSDTPRTDAQEAIYDRIYGAFDGDSCRAVRSLFARLLERELAAAQARVVELERYKKSLCFDDRDHFGKILWDAYRDNCDLLGNMGEWVSQSNGTQSEFRNMAEAVVHAAMTPHAKEVP